MRKVRSGTKGLDVAEQMWYAQCMWFLVLIFLLPAAALLLAVWIMWFLVRLLLTFALLVWQVWEDRAPTAP